MDTENKTPNPYYDRPSDNKKNIQTDNKNDTTTAYSHDGIVYHQPDYSDNDSFYNQTTDSENGPFYNRPGQQYHSSRSSKQPITPPNSFARASMTLAGIALVSVFTFTVFPPIILGALAFILALLSRGAELKMHPSAKTASLLATIALAADIAIVGGSFALVLGDNSTHDMLNDTYEQMYGITYDEFLEGIMDGTLDYEELYENMYENLDDMHYEDLDEIY